MKIPLLKSQSDSPIQRLESPTDVRFALNGIAPVVTRGEAVDAGSVVARTPNGHPKNQRLHSPLTGHVASIRRGEMIVEGTWTAPTPPSERVDIDALTPEDITAIARDAGLLGMGGARFPVHLKLTNDPPLDYVIGNGCESEPYLSCDHRVLTEHRDEVESGLQLAMRAVGAKQGRIVTQTDGFVSGYDRFLIREVLGREVPPGGVPHDVGVSVFNVQTLRALHQAVVHRTPLTERVLTVYGDPFRRRGNFTVPIGTTVRHILDVCGCDLQQTAAVILGGPMMGVRANYDSPITAGTGGVLAFTEEELFANENAKCIRCGVCFEECPVGLAAGLLTQRPTSDVLRCIECGICQFACPGKRPLVSMMRAAKANFSGGGNGKP